MASIGFLETLKAQALAEAIGRVEGLLDAPSEPLMRTREDAVARSMPGFDAAVLAAELARVAALQEERLARLEREVKILRKKPAAAARGESAPAEE